MTNILNKFKPILKEEGVFYAPPGTKEPIHCTIILEEVEREESKMLIRGINKNWRENSGRAVGFYAYHKLTSEPYYPTVVVSNKRGKSGKYIILETDHLLEAQEPVDSASNLKEALDLAHEYILKEILKDVLYPSDVYTNLMDTTKIGIERFKKLLKNKANLSADKGRGSVVNLKKYSKLEKKFG